MFLVDSLVRERKTLTGQAIGTLMVGNIPTSPRCIDSLLPYDKAKSTMVAYGQLVPFVREYVLTSGMTGRAVGRRPVLAADRSWTAD